MIHRPAYMSRLRRFTINTTDLISKSYEKQHAKLQRYPTCCVRVVRVHQISQKMQNTLIH